MMLRKIEKFEKRDGLWDFCRFYEIYTLRDDDDEDDDFNEKYIRITSMIDREPGDNRYLDWVWTFYDMSSSTCLLKDFVEWDNYYGLSKLTKDSYKIVYSDPAECFEKANSLLTNNSSIDGRYWLKILDITEDTPCGYYVGR